ncbi:MAG: polysaccharide biosynthesis tyrosine autokinase [bacterium]
MMNPAQTEGSKFDPRAYLAIFIFRWKIIFLSVILCLLAGAAYLALAPQQFLTSAVVMIYRDPTLTVSDTGSLWSTMRMHTWLLESDELHTTVIQKLQKDWQQKVGGLSRMKVPFSVQLERGQAGVLTLSVRSTIPDYAGAYVGAVWDEFKKRQEARKDDVSGKAVEVLETELKALEGDIRQAQDDLIDYTRLVAYDVVAASSDMERRYLLTLLGYKNQLNTELLLLDTQFPMVKDEGAVVVADVEGMARKAGTLTPVSDSKGEPGGVAAGHGDKAGSAEFNAEGQQVVDSPDVKRWSSMKVELMRLQAQTNALMSKFTVDHPEVKAAVQQIKDLQEQLRLSFEVAYGRLKDRRRALKIMSDALDSPIRDWNNTFRRASVNESEYRRKLLVVERREALFRTLYSRLQDLKISEELKAEHFAMIAPVKTGDKPVWPDPIKVMMAALVAALGMGIGLATLVHMFDNRMQTIADVETLLGIPFLGGVPRWKGDGVDKVARPIVLEQHASGAIESYRVLRTNVLSAMDKAGQKMAMFTSAEAKEGKTITVLNLAVMTAKVGKKVLLVDMDLRRPRLHRSLGFDRSPGVTDALMKGTPLQDVVVQTEVENLWFAPSGEECDNIAELLQQANLTAFFGAAKQKYDYIMIDTSPVLRAADVTILAARGLCSIVYVARVNKTPKPLVKYALDQLSQAHVLGVIMNHIDLSKVSSLYYAYQYPNYAYYAYSYAYGYDYDHYSDGVRGSRKKVGIFRAVLQRIGKALRRAMLPVE